MPQLSPVDRMMERLKLSGLTQADARKLKIKPVTSVEAVKLGYRDPLDGFLIPYFSLQGKPTQFSRIRYFEVKVDGFTGKEGPKYNQLPGSGNHLYLPPLLRWHDIAQATDIPLIITEGELKAACACKNELPTIGLGGVWNFKNGNSRRLEAFDEFNWADRVVYICYDSDIVMKWQVALAENNLAHELLNLGAKPYILRLPKLSDEGKTGLDDFLVAKGREAFDQVLCAAAEFEPSKELFKLNEEVLYVRDPGLVYVPADSRRLSPDAFMRHAYVNRTFYKTVSTGDGTRQQKAYTAKEWLEWPFRNEVARITYIPGGEKIVKGEVNVWPGWACEPKRGELKPWRDLLDFLFKGAKPEDRKYAEQWLAYPLQHPGTKLYTAMVIWGVAQGTGKSTIGYTMERIYGTNFREIGEQDLVGSFNDWAVNRQFVMGDEIASGENRKQMSDRMKSIITQRSLRVNTKYVPAYYIPDCINYYFTSNHPDAFFMEDGDRRFFIHEVKGAPLPNEFYDDYIDWLDNRGGKEALFHHLLNLDLAGFNPKAAAPITAAKEEMMAMSRSELGNWVNMLKTDPNSVLKIGNHNPSVIGHHLMEASELLAIFDPEERKRVTVQTMARELKRAGIERMPPVRVRDRIIKLWLVRPLDASTTGKPNKIADHYKKERNIP